MPRSALIMNVNQFQLSLKALMLKALNNLVTIPVTILTKLIRLQIQVLTFPVLFVVGGVKHVWKRTSDTEAEPPMPSSEEIVNGISKLRDSVLMGISSLQSNADPRSFKFHGTVDCPLEKDCVTCMVDEKMKETYFKATGKGGCQEVVGCSSQNQPEKMKETYLKATVKGGCREVVGCSSQNQPENSKNEHNGNKPVKVVEMKMSEFFGDDLMWDVPTLAKDADLDCLDDTDPENDYLEFMDPKSKREYLELVALCDRLGCSEVKSRKVEVKSPATNKLKSKKKAAFMENGRQKQRRNSKEIQSSILRTCVSLLQIVSGLTSKVDEFVNVAAKLKDEIDEGRKLLSDVEADRNEMKSKLAALEKLIKEEQEFLDDVSGESGFDETENGSKDS